jgi:hypothetical protein
MFSSGFFGLDGGGFDTVGDGILSKYFKYKDFITSDNGRSYARILSLLNFTGKSKENGCSRNPITWKGGSVEISERGKNCGTGPPPFGLLAATARSAFLRVIVVSVSSTTVPMINWEISL